MGYSERCMAKNRIYENSYNCEPKDPSAVPADDPNCWTPSSPCVGCDDVSRQLPDIVEPHPTALNRRERR